MSELKSPYDELNSIRVKEKYQWGLKNNLVRFYYYLQKGLELLNEFKYLGAAIIGLYIVLKLKAGWQMVGMAVVAIPILTAVGYWWVHRAQKSVEYFNLKFASHFSQYTLKIQERQIHLLEEAVKRLEEIDRKLGNKTNDN